MDSPEALISEEEQEFLLEIARKTIVSYIRDGITPELTTDNPRFIQKRGAFVTLSEKSGALRGCIGYVEPIKPLLQTIVEMAIACSTRDPRFRPVTTDEFPNLDVEVSVLTPLEKLRDVETIEIGKHGLLIKKGAASGLLLPQVATEYGWDRYRFLQETCRKAGLKQDAWQESDAELSVFSAQVFGGSLL